MKIRPYHILVKHEYEAQDIYKWLTQGKDFSELAKKYSLCSSHQNGGDLGDTDPKKLNEDFLDAFNKLNPANYSKPVRTRFGWHILYRK